WLGHRVHADVSVGTTLGASATPNAVLLDDLYFSTGDADDTVHATQQTLRILAVTTGRREKVIVYLLAPELQAAVAVTALATFDAVFTAGAFVLVGDLYFAATCNAVLHECAYRRAGRQTETLAARGAMPYLVRANQLFGCNGRLSQRSTRFGVGGKHLHQGLPREAHHLRTADG